VPSKLPAKPLQQLLGLRWRRWLTEHCLSRYLGEQVCYRLQLGELATDNPDQRIGEDVSYVPAVSALGRSR
jgi:putative ATP-binding cassette transporter